jgi:hypothetical protein
MDERKKKLIIALETEKKRLDKFFVDTTGHFLTIDYLKTGSYGCDPTEVENHPLLDAALNDYNCLLSEYGV